MPKSCQVSFTDVDGFTHSVEVQADTLYEAAILAYGRFKYAAWAKPIAKGMKLHVVVREPGVAHEVPFVRVLQWLEAPDRFPAERILKQRLKLVVAEK